MKRQPLCIRGASARELRGTARGFGATPLGGRRKRKSGGKAAEDAGTALVLVLVVAATATAAATTAAALSLHPDLGRKLCRPDWNETRAAEIEKALPRGVHDVGASGDAARSVAREPSPLAPSLEASGQESAGPHVNARLLKREVGLAIVRDHAPLGDAGAEEIVQELASPSPFPFADAAAAFWFCGRGDQRHCLS